MPKITIDAGACGETVEASAECEDGRVVKFTIGVCCEHVERMKPALELEPLDAFSLMKGFEVSPIYQSAAKCLPHVTCPVPSGFHKLVELSAGLAVPADVTMKIEG